MPVTRFTKVVRGSGLVLSVIGHNTGEIEKFTPIRITKDTLEVAVRVRPASERSRAPMPQIILDHSMRGTAIHQVRFIGEGIDTTVPLEWF